MRLNIHTHSVVMTTNTSKNHRCDINSQANVLYLSYNDSPGQLSALPLTYCSIINCGNVSKGWLLTSGYLHVRHVLSTIFSRDSVKKHVGKVPDITKNTCMRNEWMKSLKGSATMTARRYSHAMYGSNRLKKYERDPNNISQARMESRKYSRCAGTGFIYG